MGVELRIETTNLALEKNMAPWLKEILSLVLPFRNEVLSAGEDGCVAQTDLRTDTSNVIVERDKALYSIDTDYNNYIILSGVCGLGQIGHFYEK